MKIEYKKTTIRITKHTITTRIITVVMNEDGKKEITVEEKVEIR